MVTYNDDKLKIFEDKEGRYHLTIGDVDKVIIVRHTEENRVFTAKAAEILERRHTTKSWINSKQWAGTCTVKGGHAAPDFLEV